MDNLCPRSQDYELSSLSDVKLIEINSLEESNGNLAFLETPFNVKRIFYVYGIRAGNVRGHHAHKQCKQLMICIHGIATITCDDGRVRKTYHLDRPTLGLYIPPMIWAEQFYHSSEAMLVGLASHHFYEGDYVREYTKYKEQICESV